MISAIPSHIVAKHGNFVFSDAGEGVDFQPILSGISTLEDFEEAEEIAVFLLLEGQGRA